MNGKLYDAVLKLVDFCGQYVSQNRKTGGMLFVPLCWIFISGPGFYLFGQGIHNPSHWWTIPGAFGGVLAMAGWIFPFLVLKRLDTIAKAFYMAKFPTHADPCTCDQDKIDETVKAAVGYKGHRVVDKDGNVLYTVDSFGFRGQFPGEADACYAANVKKCNEEDDY